MQQRQPSDSASEDQINIIESHDQDRIIEWPVKVQRKIQRQQQLSISNTPSEGDQYINDDQRIDKQQFSEFNYLRHDESQFYTPEHLKIQQQDIIQQQINADEKFKEVKKYVEQYRQKGILHDYYSILYILQLIVNENPFMLLSQIKGKLQHYGIMPKEEEILKMLKREGYRRRRLVMKNTVKNYAFVMDARKTWAYNIDKLQLRGQQIFYLGQGIFSLFQVKGKMWLKYKSGELQTKLRDQQMVRLILIQSINKIQYYEVMKGKITIDDLLIIVDKWYKIAELQNKQSQQQSRKEQQNLKKILVVQNQSFLKEYNRIYSSSHEKQAQMRKNNLQLLGLPPFSAYLNPTLIMFNAIRYEIRKQKPKKMTQIIDLLHKQVNQLKKIDFQYANRDHRRFLDRSIDKIQFI